MIPPGRHLGLGLFFPTAAAVTYALLRGIWARDPIRGRDVRSEATQAAIVGWIILFHLAIQLAVLIGLSGASGGARLARGVIVCLGLALIAVGNLLPRTRPNLAVGIRTTRTLTDRQAWMRTHRAAGYVLVAMGAVIALSGMWLSKLTMPNVIGATALGGAAALILSYRTVHAYPNRVPIAESR